ncbi:histone H1-like repetitive region-containing protein [Lactococcus formosensis]|uniref:histone H1-like repetitive region-containing protein n=2 Tax=Lactococcus formosensis TaxID=1281486 RepID=UPI002434D85A|nr:histone H1-like repetitive region-containing protein [Lactococcus formosensis]MDG6114002.1 histone H1-like repetitive region-containing protein [Lactococcus formosensis]MDG6151613.1 histone H1-like repetitive region-containing protein [Lactococcus formosensis]MDG6175167.1 histone H1-like repetitive region-containing protein [Lactococcus formosensis]MDG6181485.1 histone H1-like repetitive region-containing protein [Lactococcus formosensis]MDG6185433.1 histone H1-like repetitive region-contai
MKKFSKVLLTLSLPFVMAVSLTGCTEAEGSKTTPDTKQSQIVKKSEEAEKAAAEKAAAEKAAAEKAAAEKAAAEKAAAEKAAAEKAAAEKAAAEKAAAEKAAAEQAAAEKAAAEQAAAEKAAAEKAAAEQAAAEKAAAEQAASMNRIEDSGQIYTKDQGAIIGNSKSKIYHLPGQAGYHMNSSNAVYFDSEEQAIAAGYRKSKR